MGRNSSGWLAAAALALAPAAHAESLKLVPPALVDDGGGDGEHGGAGALLGGKVLGSGDAILAQFGWPGLSVTYLHGLGNRLDMGGRFTFNYGFEGVPQIDPGIKLAGVLRLELLDNGKVSFALQVDPGLAFYFRDQFHMGINMPVAALVGIAVGDAINVHLGMDVPMAIFVTPTTYFSLPLLFGGGVEYRVDSHLSLTLDLRFGPDIFIHEHYSETLFNFRTLMGVGYRF